MARSELFRGYLGKVMLVACLGSLMGTLDSTIVSVSLPTITKDLGMDGSAAIWVPAAYLVTMAVLLLTVGRYSDMHGRKWVFIGGFSIFTIGSLLCSLASDGGQLIAFRAVQGIGGAFITATSSAIITNTVPPNIRGRALGINTMSIYAGLSLGPALGGLLTHAFGWRSIFLVNLPIGILVIVMAVLWLMETELTRTSKSFDVRGALVFSIALVSLMVALTLGSKQGWDLASVSLLVLAIALMPIFIWVEKGRKGWAMFDLDLLLHNRLFAAANLSALLNYLAYYNISFMMSFYMQSVLGWSILVTGTVLLVTPVVMALVSPLSGWGSDRLGSRALATGGMAIVMVSMILMLTLDQRSGMDRIVPLMALQGVGMGMFSTPNTSAVMGCVRKDQLGLASGTISLMRTVGMSLSLVIMAMALSVFGSPEVMAAMGDGGTGALNPQLFIDGMRASLAVSAVISLVGVVTSSTRPSGKGAGADGSP